MKYLYCKLSYGFYAWALMLVSASIFMFKTLSSNAKAQFNGDEYLSLMAAYFTWKDACFWHVKSFTAVSYPYAFIELSYYLRILPRIFDHTWLYLNMEWILRLPVVLHVIFASFAAFFILDRLTKKNFLSAFLAVHICLFPYSTLHLASELRHHSQGWSFSWFSWACLIGFLTVKTESRWKKGIWLSLWMFVGFLASNAHIYSIYNLLVQILVFSWFIFYPRLGGESRSKLPKSIGLGVILVFVFILGQAFYQYKYKLRIPQPPEVTGSLYEFIYQAILGFAYQSFFPNLWVCGVVFCAYLSLNRQEFFLKRKFSVLLWILLVGIVSQLLVSIWLATKTTSYSGVEFVGRYTYVTIPTIFVFLGFLIRYVDFSKKNVNTMQNTEALGRYFRVRQLFLTVYLVFALGYFYLYQETFWSVHDGERSGFLQFKKQVLANDLLGKIYKTVGLNASKDHPATGKVFLGRSYVMYLNSPFPYMTQRQGAEGGACGYGGILRLESSCDDLSSYPLVSSESLLNDVRGRESYFSENVITDFCNPSHVVLRRIP